VSIGECGWARARCLTLTIAANAARTGRFTGLRTSLTRPLSCPRARVVHRRLSKVFRAIQPFRFADGFRRGPGREKLVNCWLVAALLAWIKSPASASLIILSLRDSAAATPVARAESARFRRARWLTRQFATGSSPARCIAQASFRSLPYARPQICRDSQWKIRALPKRHQQRPRRCAPRAARTVTAFPVLADRARRAA